MAHAGLREARSYSAGLGKATSRFMSADLYRPIRALSHEMGNTAE